MENKTVVRIVVIGFVAIALIGAIVTVGGGAFNFNFNWGGTDCSCPTCPTCPACPSCEPPKGWTWVKVPNVPPVKPDDSGRDKVEESLIE